VGEGGTQSHHKLGPISSDYGNNVFIKINNCWAPWLTPVIPLTQEAEIRRIVVRGQPEQIVCKILSQKNQQKIGLVEWLKVKALSSISSTAVSK
jgi:hypothetical protein